MKFLTVGEFARAARISESTVWRLIRRGDLIPVRLGERVLFTGTDLVNLADRYRQRAARPERRVALLDRNGRNTSSS